MSVSIVSERIDVAGLQVLLNWKEIIYFFSELPYQKQLLLGIDLKYSEIQKIKI